MSTRDISEYVSDVKKTKEKERKEVEDKLRILQKKISALNTKTETLLDELFRPVSDLVRLHEITKELKGLSPERIELYSKLYKWEMRYNQLKYI